MDSGVYALYWWRHDLVYVGLSQDLHRRESEHYRLMRLGSHTNYKIQVAYNTYGYPDFTVLERCSLIALHSKEIEWTAELDALGQNGLCIVEPGLVGFGPNSNSSKYTKLQILKVFRYLYTTCLNYPVITTITGVSSHTISDIAVGKSHLWLQDVYPFQYSKIRKRDTGTNMLRSSPSKLLSPDGRVLECLNIRDFARQYKLHNTCLGEVIRGNRKSHKGWTLAHPNMV